MELNNYRSSRHSQHGEDGIIAEILKRLDIRDSNNCWAVEFGAWDGIYLSNTFAKVEDGWNAVYIECEEERYKDLLKTKETYDKIIPILSYVSRFKDEPDSLDNLLANTPIPKDFELLSIDIDSYDLDVWESVTNYSPKIVVIETNSSMEVINDPTWRHTIDNNGDVLKQGNSLAATLIVASNKNYSLLAYTGNAIFVRNDLLK